MSMRTQRSSISTSMNGNGFEPRSGRMRTSTGPPQMVSDVSSNWRDRNSDGVHRDSHDGHDYGGDDDGDRFGGASIKTRSGRRRFGFGAGGTRADEMCRLNAPYFQGSQGFQAQAQRQPLRRSQRCVFCKIFSLPTVYPDSRPLSSIIGSGAVSAAEGGDLRRRSSLADKVREGGVGSIVMDSVWNRRGQERAAAAAAAPESVRRIEGAVVT